MVYANAECQPGAGLMTSLARHEDPPVFGCS